MVIEVKQDGKFVKIPFISTNYPVGEAPEDGKQYARQDATWSEIVIPEVDLTEIETNIATNTAAIDTKVDKVDGKQLSTEDYTTEDKTKVSNLPTPESIVVTTDPRLTVATTTKAGLMSAADKVQLDSTLTATEIENKVNAAVSSVYRVKGNVATVSNLPTSNVAIGDVYNITDSGANYVAVNNNPVEWDKLSETVDLAPYMQTSTANSTFVKKSGDTMTGDLIINSSKAATVEGTNELIVRNRADDRYAELSSLGVVFKPSNTANHGQGLYVTNGNRTKTLGQMGFSTSFNALTDTTMYFTWGGVSAGTPSKSLLLGEDKFTYKNVPVALTNDNKDITVHKTAGSNNRTIHHGSGLAIIPTNNNNSTGITWRKQDNSENLLMVGAFTNGDSTSNYMFMGWSAEGYQSGNNLSVGADRLTYRGNRIWYEGNDGSGSGLDADTVDGIHANDFFIGNLKSITNESIANGASFQDLSSGSFPVTSGASASALFSFKCPSASTSAIQFHATYDGSSIGYRTQVDNNRYTNWQNVSLGPSTSVLTQDEYNALGSTVNSDGKIYFIKE
jgi:hypothetical protein